MAGWSQHDVIDPDCLLVIRKVGASVPLRYIPFREEHMDIVTDAARREAGADARLFGVVHDEVFDDDAVILSDASKKWRAKNEFEGMPEHGQGGDHCLEAVHVESAPQCGLREGRVAQKLWFGLGKTEKRRCRVVGEYLGEGDIGVVVASLVTG